jgi:hypothetical protein
MEALDQESYRKRTRRTAAARDKVRIKTKRRNLEAGTNQEDKVNLEERVPPSLVNLFLPSQYRFQIITLCVVNFKFVEILVQEVI